MTVSIEARAGAALDGEGVERAGGLAPPGDGTGEIILDADAGGVGLGDEALLNLGVVLDGAMTVDVVGRDVEEHGDGRVGAGRQIDLEG